MFERKTLGVIMDPIRSIHPEKDPTLALLVAAKRLDFDLYYMELPHLFLEYGIPWGYCAPLQVYDGKEPWYSLGKPAKKPLSQFDVLLMRKDSPVNLEYLYSTYILEHAEQNGALIINKPQGLRDANEKLFTTWFPQCMPPTLVSCSKNILEHFIEEHSPVVLKTLDGMRGQSIFKCEARDQNLTVILELLTQNGLRPIMAQQFIPEIENGNKKILLIDGEPIPYALARIPVENEFRGNLAAGKTEVGCPLTERDWWICSQVGPLLREKGLIFVSIHVIGDYLTEINVTNPSCIKELEREFTIDVTGKMMNCIMDKLDE